MDEQAKFNAWWESKGINSVILRAQAWSAWLARAEAEQPQPAEDPDEWVILDPVNYAGHVLRKNIDFTNTRTGWEPISIWGGDTIGGVMNDYKGERVLFRCRRRDLPKVEQAEQWPKYYTTIDSPSSDVAFVKRVDETSYSVVYKNGRECPGFLWVAKNQSRRKQLTEAEAMALLNPTSNAYFSYHEKQKPQPQKTRVRLWVSQSAVIVRDANETVFGKEIHHDSEGFYVEEPS